MGEKEAVSEWISTRDGSERVSWQRPIWLSYMGGLGRPSLQGRLGRDPKEVSSLKDMAREYG